MTGLDRALPVTYTEHSIWYKNLIEDKTKIAYSIWDREISEIVGMVNLNNLEWRHRKAEVRIVIDPNKQARGYGTQALIRISNIAFMKLGLNKLYAYILENNTPSIKAFEDAVFLEEARLKKDRLSNGEFIDVFVYSKWK
jgi:RimJ/RimL family protein N-acetyltransferase